MQLADALWKTLDDAHRVRSEPPFTPKLPQGAEIRACADELMALVLRLRDEQRIDARGVTMTALLHTTGASPLDPASGESLRRAVRSARLALDGPTHPRQDRRHAA